MYSCAKTDMIVTEHSDSKTSIEDQSTYSFIKKMGYTDEEIKDIGDEYLVDGDILFSKSDTLSFSIFEEGPRTKQYGTNYYVGYNVQPFITVRIDGSMIPYASEINGAIAMWNNVPNSRVKFLLTTATNQEILITNSYLGPGTCAAAYFPINGRPGAIIRINIYEIAGDSPIQRQSTIAHELGHTIGFRHTNWNANPSEPRGGTLPDNGAKFNAMHLLGTPTGGDVNSIMNRAQCGVGATSLSSFDILALQFLYPASAPVAGSVPVFRYYRDNIGGSRLANHFFTTNINELGNGNVNGYNFEGIGFFAFTSQVVGTVPVYRYFSSLYNNHYYDRNFQNYSGYTYESIAFYAYPSSMNGASPVYRYMSHSDVDHHYTKNPNESPFSGYNYEGIAFYAH